MKIKKTKNGFEKKFKEAKIKDLLNTFKNFKFGIFGKNVLKF